MLSRRKLNNNFSKKKLSLLEPQINQLLQEEIKQELNKEITKEQLDFYNEEFNENKQNIIAKNAVTTVGSHNACIDHEKSREINHEFIISVKKKDVKATNQYHSGRCWMFAGLNIFKYFVINALNLKDFEFSETYLFFYDKLERSNKFLQWFIDEDTDHTDRRFNFYISEYMQDGGYWSFFANLVEKYGLLPKSCMKETYQSVDSEDMNSIIQEKLKNTANSIMKLKKKYKNKSSKNLKEELMRKKEETVKHIYNILVKFLGSPPNKKFPWYFTDDESETKRVMDLDSKIFKALTIPIVNIREDFVTLTNLPSLEYNKVYEVKESENIVGMGRFKFLNLPIDKLIHYTKKSISHKFPVWFGSDVMKDYEFYSASLDPGLLNKDIVFGKSSDEFSKKDRILFRETQGTHAMTITGFNIDEKDRVTNWQVENSWGYIDNETPGLDGFLSMDNEWYKKNVTDIVINKNFLSRTIQKMTRQEPILIEPWDAVAPALKITGVEPPKYWKDRVNKRISKC